MQLFNYHAKQSGRWLQAVLLSEKRDFVTKEEASQLGQHLDKSEYRLQHPRIIDTVLLPGAQWLLSELETEQEAAKAEQGNPERVHDWWAEPTMVGKKHGKKMRARERREAAAAQNVSAEGLREEDGASGWEDSEMDVEEGGVLLVEEEEFEGFNSPVMMSPGGPEMGDGAGEGEDEEEEEE